MKLRTPSPEIHAGIYRQFVTGKDLKRFWVSEEQSDLLISAHGVFVEKARAALLEARSQIIGYAAGRKSFYSSLQPLEMDESAPPVVRDMLMAGIAASVGPMAAVAGAVAQFVGEALLGLSDKAIVENGGDVYVCTQTPHTMCVYVFWQAAAFFEPRSCRQRVRTRRTYGCGRRSGYAAMQFGTARQRCVQGARTFTQHSGKGSSHHHERLFWCPRRFGNSGLTFSVEQLRWK